VEEAFQPDSESDLLDRADADAVGLAEGAIDCPGLGHPHFGPANERGDVERVSVAVADKAGGAFGREDRCLEDEAIRPESHSESTASTCFVRAFRIPGDRSC